MGVPTDAQDLDRALTLRLPPELHDELRAYAEAEDRSIAGILRTAARRRAEARGGSAD